MRSLREWVGWVGFGSAHTHKRMNENHDGYVYLQFTLPWGGTEGKGRGGKTHPSCRERGGKSWGQVAIHTYALNI